jgi:hypothetical protein
MEGQGVRKQRCYILDSRASCHIFRSPKYVQDLKPNNKLVKILIKIVVSTGFGIICDLSKASYLIEGKH